MANIIFLGDLHIKNGDDAKRISQWLKKHLNPNTDRLILMGDLIDSGLDRGMNWNQDNVNRQITFLQAVIKPYKVLGYVLGNHEIRIRDKVGLNPYQLLFGDETTEYTTGKYKIAIQHGKSGAQNQTLELDRLSIANPDANIVALGHTHTIGIYVLNRGVIGIRTGSLQEYPDYAKRSMMIPKTLGCIRLNTRTHQFEILI